MWKETPQNNNKDHQTMRHGGIMKVVSSCIYVFIFHFSWGGGMRD